MLMTALKVVADAKVFNLDLGSRRLRGVLEASEEEAIECITVISIVNLPERPHHGPHASTAHDHQNEYLPKYPEHEQPV